ncbi:hypothetical protein R1sor_026963 [Riccia sorocarpa]|uniref:Vacuolar ATPase assembly integral membrane protein VMA21 homolog n=1 Tax=Riccia sorocarpa TaxID=122646 RepID=A0ABD3GG14_9MARC
MEETNLVFALNGQRVELKEVDPQTSLLTFIRDRTDFKGTKRGCGEGTLWCGLMRETDTVLIMMNCSSGLCQYHMNGNVSHRSCGLGGVVADVGDISAMAVSRVMIVFTIASMLMWILPIGVLQAFNWNLIPGLEALSPRSRTLWSGALAVLCVNVVIVGYICFALQESTPATEPQPDPIFLRRAEESVAAARITAPSTSEQGQSGEIEVDKSGKAD